MGKVLVAVLGLCAVLYGAYQYLYAQKDPDSLERQEASAPKRALDNVRGAATRIEDDAQRRADELMQKTGGN